MSGPGELYFFGSPPISSRSSGFSISCSFVRCVRHTRRRSRTSRRAFLYISGKKIITATRNSIYIHRHIIFVFGPLVRVIRLSGPRGPRRRRVIVVSDDLAVYSLYLNVKLNDFT